MRVPRPMSTPVGMVSVPVMSVPVMSAVGGVLIAGCAVVCLRIHWIVGRLY